jgi:hypothetical protein
MSTRMHHALAFLLGGLLAVAVAESMEGRLVTTTPVAASTGATWNSTAWVVLPADDGAPPRELHAEDAGADEGEECMMACRSAETLPVVADLAVSCAASRFAPALYELVRAQPGGFLREAADEGGKTSFCYWFVFLAFTDGFDPDDPVLEAFSRWLHAYPRPVRGLSQRNMRPPGENQ